MSQINIAPKVNIEIVELTNHAYQRVSERLNIKDRKQALTTIRQMLARSRYMGLAVGEEDDDVERHVFASGRTAIYLDLNLTTVITVIKLNESKLYSGLRDKVEQMFARELNKIKVSEDKLIKRFTDTSLKSDVEVADLKLKIHRARNDKTKEKYRYRITEINNELKESELELKSFKNKKRQLIRSIISLNFDNV